jgi:integrase
MKTKRKLWDLCTGLLFVRRTRIRSEQTRRHYRYALNDFDAYLGREATEADLDDDVVTGWLCDMLRRCDDPENGGSVETANSKVGRVLTLWRFLADRFEIRTRPTVELQEAPDPVPVALDEYELRRLFEAAHCQPKSIAGIPARYWWPALFGFFFSTSERRGATLALRWEWVDLRRKVVTIPARVRKGKRKPGTYRLWDEVVWLLQRIMHPRREMVFPWDKSDTSYFKRYGQILIDAGLPNDRRHKSQCLRVTHNTWVKVMTGQHSPLLQHGSIATSEQHYEDKRFTTKEPVKPFVPWLAGGPLAEQSAILLDESPPPSRGLPRAKLIPVAKRLPIAKLLTGRTVAQ